MSASEESCFSGGARPKTTIAVGKKDKKKTDYLKNESKNSKLHEYSESKSERDSVQIVNRQRDTCGDNGDGINVIKPLWNKSSVPSYSRIMNDNCGTDSDFSTNSINLFRTKQPCLQPVVTSSRVNNADSIMTGSLHNLSLETQSEVNIAENNHLQHCNGASDILQMELGSSRANETMSPQSCSIINTNSSAACNICKADNPEALVKWKTAGLALRQLLLKKSNKDSTPSKQLTHSQSHKHHQKSDHTSCWLQRLKDFDEYDEEYFSCCTCDDAEDATLTKTGSSSSLASFDSEQMLKLPSDMRGDMLENEKVCCNCDNNRKESSLSLVESPISEVPLFSDGDYQLPKETNQQTQDVSSSNLASTPGTTPLTNTICNSIVWEMLQKPYTVAFNDSSVDNTAKNQKNKTKFGSSPNTCDTFPCNAFNLENEPDNMCTAPPSNLFSEFPQSHSSLMSLYRNRPILSQLSSSFHSNLEKNESHSSLQFQKMIHSDYRGQPFSCRVTNVHGTRNAIEFNEETKSKSNSFGNFEVLEYDNNSKLDSNKSNDCSINVHDEYEAGYQVKVSSPELTSLHYSDNSQTHHNDHSPCCHHRSSLLQPLLESLTASNSCTCNTSSHNDSDILASCSNCDTFTSSKFASIPSKSTNSINKNCAMCHYNTTAVDTSNSSVLSSENQVNMNPENISCNNSNNIVGGRLLETESEVTDYSSVYADTSGEIFFSEGTDSSDLPSKFLRLNPTKKDDGEYCAKSAIKEKKKKVLHTRKSHRRSGSTSSDVEENDKLDENKGCPIINDELGLNDEASYMYRNNFMLTEILHPSTPLARFLKSHTCIPNEAQNSTLPWENIEDGLSVESCADGDSVSGFSNGSTIPRKHSWVNFGSLDEKNGQSTEVEGKENAHKMRKSESADLDGQKSTQERPSKALRKLLNMEINTELKGDNSQYSPETWIRLVDQISLPFECTEEDGTDIVNDTTLVDSTEKSNEFADLCLPNYESSTSCDADDEFECDCEHCQLLKSMGNTDDVTATTATAVTSSTTAQNYYTWPDFLEDDTSLDLDLSELRPLEPLLMNLQDIPQDLIDIMFQNVIMQMLAVHPELMGDQAPPPVPQDVIEGLPIVLTTQLQIDQELSCPICLCPCQLNESLTRLCCQHLYHPLCIQAWLTKSGTCPVCRCAINGNSGK
ncbi:hypothetical protein SNE40_007254 [Patella caerulea]|uniref:RING-type domain-containing protein n=1 Tax=Patella caerulea TaxID=87958 RepID=A0AAN8JZC6_PATCE